MLQDSPQLCCPLERLLRLRFYANKSPKQLQHKASPFGGRQRIRKRGHGVEFHQARPYVNGDDIRTIDWRITARKGKAHTREFHQDHERPQMLVVDMQPHMRFASSGKFKSVQAAEYATWLGWRHLKQGNRIGAVINLSQYQSLKPTLNSKRYSYWLNQLSLATQNLLNQPQEQEPLSWRTTIQQAIKLITPGSQVHLIGDLINLDEGAWQLLSHLARHYSVEAVHIQDPLELKMPKNRHLSVTDGSTTVNLSYNSYQRVMQQQLQDLHQRLEKIAANLNIISTQDSLFEESLFEQDAV